MIKPLRRYHYYVWRVFAVALPLLFILAILFRPEAQVNRTIDESFHIDSNEISDSSVSVTIEIVKPLEVPSCVVYAVRENGRELLGLLNARRVYSFTTAPFDKIIIMDKIKNTKIREWNPEN